MRDRSSQADLALAFVATFVITLAIWPKTPPRQIVRCNTADQGWQTYSIAVDDPSLVTLRQKVKRWQTPESHPQYVTAKWQKEVAEFYENCKPCEVEDSAASESESGDPNEPTTATISDTVTTASYEVTAEDDSQVIQAASFVESVESTRGPAESDQPKVDGSVASPSDANYWSTVKASATNSMAVIEERSANVPIIFERVAPAAWPQLAFHFAFLFGVAAACVYMHWLRFTPTRRGASFGEQPLGVLARIGTFSGAIILAMVCSIAVWI